jgi:hypothetical protein
MNGFEVLKIVFSFSGLEIHTFWQGKDFQSQGDDQSIQQSAQG